MTDNIKVYWIDLFCGAGGTSTGINLDGNSEVLACVNHDANAIKSHKENHPDCYHFTEDIRTLDVSKLKVLVDEVRQKYPSCKINLWASLECTNFSNAKGGAAKDADSRTLARDLYRYIVSLNPDYIFIENVREFMSWGPLDDKGKPLSKESGTDYLNWMRNVCSFGYKYDYRLLNSADFGAYTSRLRYFGQFARKKNFITWPEATHSEKAEEGMNKWKPVKDILNFEDQGKSIFNRKKPLVDNTLRKILVGLKKFLPENEDKNGEFLIKYYSCGTNAVSVDKPSPTIGTKDTCAKINFMMINYGNAYNKSIDKPASSVLVNDKHNLVSAFLYNPQWGGHFKSVEKPCFTIIARMDKAPPNVIITEKGFGIKIEDSDTDMMKELKKFMSIHGISDVKMRMLNIPELLQIQGFPKDYKLIGNKGDQKKYIGNAVECNMAKALANANFNKINKSVLC